MANGNDLFAHGLQGIADFTRGLALAHTGAHGTDRHHRLGGFNHGLGGSEQAEGRAAGNDLGGLVHDIGMGYIAVGEDNFIYFQGLDELAQFAFGKNGDAFRVELATEFCRVDSALDIRNLSSGKGHHLHRGIVAIHDIKVVEVAPRGSHDKNAAFLHYGSPSLVLDLRTYFLAGGYLLHHEGHDGLLHMEAILGFVPDHRLRSVDNFVGHFFVAVRRQAVQEKGIGLG